MFTYKIQVKKIKGFITESVQSQGLNLTIKSKKKMTNESLFEKADDYLNEKYGIRLVEAKFRPHNSPARLSGNTHLKKYFGNGESDNDKTTYNNLKKRDFLNIEEIETCKDLYRVLRRFNRKGIISDDDYEYMSNIVWNQIENKDSDENKEEENAVIDRVKSLLYKNKNIKRMYTHPKRMYTTFSYRVADDEYDASDKKRRGARQDLSSFENRRKKVVCEVHWQSGPFIKDEDYSDWDDEDWRSYDRYIKYINSLSDEGWKLVFARNEGEIEKEIIKKLINPKYGNYPKTERLDDNGFKFVVETKKGLIEYRVFYTIATGKRATELRNMDEGDYIDEKEGDYSSDYESPYYRHGVTGKFLHDDDPRGWVY